jgi:MFS family permease
MKVNPKYLVPLTILVSALGYFVDIYDILLFSIVRQSSLASLGVAPEQSLDVGLSILNWQVGGLILGGILWGAIGDKKGRLSVLFFSILLYSLANFLNGYIVSVEQYKWCRFIAGIGLAGELGAGITIVSEIMSKQKRGYGTLIISSVGMLGAVFAAIIGLNLPWQTAYNIGGILGFLLLALRFGVAESGMYQHMKQQSRVPKGNFFYLFANRTRFIKYLKCILIGLPTYFIVGLLLTGAPELLKSAFNLQVEPTLVAKLVIVTYTAIAVADIGCSWLSQKLKSRRIPLLLFLGISLVGTLLILFFPITQMEQVYVIFSILGCSIGFWAVMMSNATEQFGTNIRAMATTTVPNFIRGLLIPMTFVFQALKPGLGIQYSLAIVGIPVILMAIYAAYSSEETFNKDLDYVE